MQNLALPPDAERALETIRNADIVIGIPSFNNERTIGHVVSACYAGLSKYFPQFTSVVINSDGGSTDRTREAVLSTSVDHGPLMLISTPGQAAHRLSFPYHGIPGKGSAFRLVFEMARRLGAQGCAVVDSDLRSITPEWIDLLLRPILFAHYDFVAPYYHRHKYDGTITNSIVYPLTRSLYCSQIRQPIGGEFGVSAALIKTYLEKDVWETDVARFGIDIWMTTVAIAEGFRICQSFLGAKLHDAKDPGADLSAMLHQVVSSVFSLMEQYESVWPGRTEGFPVPLFGFRFEVGLDPIHVNVERMIEAFHRGCKELEDVWKIALQPETLSAISAIANDFPGSGRSFRLSDEIWATAIMEFAVAYRNNPIDRPQLLRSLTPLYLGRVASFVLETEKAGSQEVEDRIEQLCACFIRLKPYLVALWTGRNSVNGPGHPTLGLTVPLAKEKSPLEVENV